MLDRWMLRLVRPPLELAAARLKRCGCTADQISWLAFAIGMAAVPALLHHQFRMALVCIVLNRIGDGLDGALARMTKATDAGGFLDIVLDFLFYGAVVFGFAGADPERNGLVASLLLLSFIGAGSSFLAFAVMAERRGLANRAYPQKGIYYLTGLAEGSETLLFFILCCIFPSYFPSLGTVFAIICLLTTATRVVGGYLSLR